MTADHENPTQRPGATAPLAGREVARIGFGAMQLERADRERALAVLRAAVDAGVDHIDTADFYGDANAHIAQALRRDDGGYPDELVLATKVGARRDPSGALVSAQRPHELREDVRSNLATLRTDHLGLVYLRRLDAAPGLVAQGDQVVDLDDQLAELVALRDAGVIGAIGLSAVDEGRLTAALPAGIAAVQNLYGVLERAGESLLKRCRAHGVAWIPFFPLGSAFPDRTSATEDPTVRAVAAELGVTPAQVALAWLLAHDVGTLLIPGTSDPAHLRENLAVGDIRLTPDAIARLDGVGAASAA